MSITPRRVNIFLPNFHNPIFGPIVTPKPNLKKIGSERTKSVRTDDMTDRRTDGQTDRRTDGRTDTPDRSGNVYEYGPVQPISLTVSLEENVEKKVVVNDYEWNFRYTFTHGDYGSKVQVFSKFLSRYVFDDKVVLIVNVEQAGQKFATEFELHKKMNQEQCMDMDLVKQEQGSNTDVKITLELVIKDMDYVGVNSAISCALKSPSRPHDAILIVGQEKFYVQKKYLATWSKFFDELFFGEFVEEDEKEFTLDSDIHPEEFMVLLKIIHPDQTVEIDDSNVEFLLNLTDYLKIPSVFAQSVSYLMDSKHCPNLSLMDKLQISDKHKLANLQVSVLKEFHKMEPAQQMVLFDENRERIREFDPVTMRNII